MINFSHREYSEEIMDDLSCSGEVVEQTLKELDTINRLLGGNSITVKGVINLVKGRDKKAPLTIIDMGCGSGDMLRKICIRLKAMGFANMSLIGIDANPFIVEYAKAHTPKSEPVEFVCSDVLSKKYPVEKVDLIISTLFTHHFDEADLVKLLSHWQSKAKIGVIINDLHRNRIAYYSIKWLTAVFSKSEMVKNDGPLSVLRGFSSKDIGAILKKANIDRFSLKWRWAFRWRLIIYP